MRRLVLVSLVFALTLSGYAQELGRGPLAPEGGRGLGRAPLPAAQYDGFAGAGTWGWNVGLGWANVDWDLGPATGSDGAFVPQVSLFYKATDAVDVNVSTLFLSADSTDDQFGDTEARLTRMALGARYWVRTLTQVTPYFGGGIGYYLLDGDTENTREDGQVVPASVSVEDAPGAFLEGGAAFLVSDGFLLHADIAYDFLLGSADAEINGAAEDFDVTSLSFNLGATWMF